MNRGALAERNNPCYLYFSGTANCMFYEPCCRKKCPHSPASFSTFDSLTSWPISSLGFHKVLHWISSMTKASTS
jgi:hypothetical protein